MDSRNTAKGFGERTMKNLRVILNARRCLQLPDAHEVTQLANSLLGLVVFPFQEGNFGNNNAKDAAEKETIQQWSTQNKGNWNITLAACDCGTKKITWKPKTIRCLVRHIRNAAAHGRITFSSDERELENVTFAIEDGDPQAKPFKANFMANIDGADLLRFCQALSQLVS